MFKLSSSILSFDELRRFSNHLFFGFPFFHDPVAHCYRFGNVVDPHGDTKMFFYVLDSITNKLLKIFHLICLCALMKKKNCSPFCDSLPSSALVSWTNVKWSADRHDRCQQNDVVVYHCIINVGCPRTSHLQLNS